MTKPVPETWPLEKPPEDDLKYKFDLKMGKKREAKLGVFVNNTKPIAHPVYADCSGKEIKVDEKNAVDQETGSEWPIYQEGFSPPANVWLDNKAALNVIDLKISTKTRGEDWSADFDRQKDLKMNCANYGRAARIKMKDEWSYAVFKGYHQLCDEEEREIVLRAQYTERDSKYEEDVITEGDLLKGQEGLIHFNVLTDKAQVKPDSPQPMNLQSVIEDSPQPEWFIIFLNALSPPRIRHSKPLSKQFLQSPSTAYTSEHKWVAPFSLDTSQSKCLKVISIYNDLKAYCIPTTIIIN